MRQKHRPTLKRHGKKAPAYTYTGVVDDHATTVAFPPGTRIKGELLGFPGCRDHLRSGQLVVARDPSGATPSLCFFHQESRPYVVAVVRLVILPKLPRSARAEVPKVKGVRYL